MGDVPILVADPVRHDPDGMWLDVPDRDPVRLRNGAGLIRGLLEGWRAESLCTLLDPLWLLVLRHRNDDVACWYLGRDGVLVAAPQHRREIERLPMGHRLQTLALWLGVAAGAPIRLAVPAAVAQRLRAYLALPDAVREGLDELLDEPHLTLLRSWRQGGADPSLLLSGEAPELGFEAGEDGRRIRIGNPGRLVELMAGDAPAELGEGWRIERIDNSLAPMLVLLLRHADGTGAAWYADPHGRRIGHHAEVLPASFRNHATALIEPMLRDLWQDVVVEGGAPAPDWHACLGSLPPPYLAGLVTDVLARSGVDGPTRIWSLDEPPPVGLAYVVPTARGLLALEAHRIERCLAHSPDGEMHRLLREDCMLWPSPIDDTMLRSDGGTLLIDRLTSAHRFEDTASGLSFHVVCHGGHCRQPVLYFAGADLLVVPYRAAAETCGPFRQARATLLRHLLTFGSDLAAGAMLPRDPTIQKFFGSCSDHIGHHVWQDLAGLSRLLRAVPERERLPVLNVFDNPRNTAFFGPVARLFPVFEGRVRHHPGTFDAGLGVFYRRNQRVIRHTASTVPDDMGPAVIAAAEREPGLQALREAADAARGGSAPVILFGLRAGNRTLDDLEAFGIALLAELGRRYPGCTVVLDGMNDVLDRGAGVPAPPGSQLVDEFAISIALREAGAGLGVRVVDNVNRSALASVLWCSRCDAFVAPLGAALAKYRWICNTPGLVLSSRWNLLNRSDLHIYDSPTWMERPSEMLFNGADIVLDTNPEMDVGSHDGRGNFVVERAPVFQLLAGLVDRHHARRRPAKIPRWG